MLTRLTEWDGALADRAAYFTLSSVSLPPAAVAFVELSNFSLQDLGGVAQVRRRCGVFLGSREVHWLCFAYRAMKSSLAAGEQRRVTARVELRKLTAAGACGRSFERVFRGQRFRERLSSGGAAAGRQRRFFTGAVARMNCYVDQLWDRQRAP
jgi:hypothetical protein